MCSNGAMHCAITKTASIRQHVVIGGIGITMSLILFQICNLEGFGSKDFKSVFFYRIIAFYVSILQKWNQIPKL